MGVLVLRADAGGSQGSGHVMRLAALGEAWVARGGAVTLASHRLPPALAERLRAQGSLAIHDLSAAPWTAADAAELSTVAAGADAVLVDSYLHDGAYLAALKAAGLKLGVIDDMGRLPSYACDLIVNPNFHGAAHLYEGKTDAAVLIGPHFAMLRPEFAVAGARGRTIGPEVKSILATFGGVDPKGASEKCLRAFETLGHAFQTELIIGAANPRAEALARETPSYVRLTRDARDLGERFAGADIVFSAGGTTVWEALCVGAPLLLTAVAPEEAVSAQRLAEAGACAFAGPIETLDSASIARALQDFAGDLAARARSHVMGKELVDGRGAGRVAEALASL